MTNGKLNREVFDVAVVGGGISGCATAYFLSRSGARVLLLERHDLNTEASGRNAGSLHGQIQHEPFLEEGRNGHGTGCPPCASSPTRSRSGTGSARSSASTCRWPSAADCSSPTIPTRCRPSSARSRSSRASASTAGC
ncbi:NAD(P)/FAD-dependent oxidoreductase [Leucobacter soli]|uniref:NAD(P)/FAD-dependent oxidoreductase n=1 Tax=Leucobacter soli TaxID=2812850 RepID=UPI0036210A00